MELPPWGQLPKSQIDPEKIEEAIARMIKAHNDDPAAHTEAGQSLYNHKVAEVIQHAVASIVSDKIGNFQITPEKLNWDKTFIDLGFESIEGWDIYESEAGAFRARLVLSGMVAINEGGTNAEVELHTFNELIDFLWPKNPTMQILAQANDISNALMYIVMGGYIYEENFYEYAGFKIYNGNLYAVHSWVDGDDIVHDETTLMSGVDATKWHIYRTVCDYSGNKIYFYIDNNLKATHTENLPWAGGKTYEPSLITLSIKKTGTKDPFLSIQKLTFIQDK